MRSAAESRLGVGSGRHRGPPGPRRPPRHRACRAPLPTPPVAPDPPAPPAAAPGPNGKGSQAGKHNLDGSYWSAALPAAKRSAAARAAAAEARFEAAARGASAGAVATEAVAAEAVVWQCDRCAALLGRAVYARGVDGFYHRGVAVARDEHGQMQVA